MSGRARCFKLWTENPDALKWSADKIAAETDLMASSVNVYKTQFRCEQPRLSHESVEAGKKLRNSEQKRRWKIEEACNVLIEEQASLHDMQTAGLQFVVLKAA